MTDPHSLIEAFYNAGQSQVFRFWKELPPAERETLLEEAAEIDLEEIARLHKTLVTGGDEVHQDFSG